MSALLQEHMVRETHLNSSTSLSLMIGPFLVCTSHPEISLLVRCTLNGPGGPIWPTILAIKCDLRPGATSGQRAPRSAGSTGRSWIQGPSLAIDNSKSQSQKAVQLFFVFSQMLYFLWASALKKRKEPAHGTTSRGFGTFDIHFEGLRWQSAQ
jgi:hypothetical protein